MRLLLAEDDIVLGRAVCRFLMQQGHAVDWATTGNQMVTYAAEYPYDCILLDLGLPELGGTDCLRNVRTRGNATPVIVITASGFRETRIAALDDGADDYLVKPFDLNELQARIDAVTRRSAPALPAAVEDFECGPLRLSPSLNAVTVDGQVVRLTAKEFMVLRALAARLGRIVSRAQIEEEVHGFGDGPASNTVEVLVHQLRRKIGNEAIRTVRGLGYVLHPDLARAAASDAAR